MEKTLASAFLKPVLEQLGSSIVTEFGLLWGVKKDLDKLSSFLSAIQSVLQDAEEKQIHSHQVRDWMIKLKDAAYDAEDVLDEFATEALRSKVEDGNQTSKWEQVCNLFLYCFGLKSSLHFRYEISHKIKKINERLDGIAKERNDLHLLLDGGLRRPETWKRPETTSLIHESDVFGRGNDKEKLINLLVSDGSAADDLSVIPIVGMGGIGKTTLAKLVYNDKRVENHFDIRGWVCVSEDFDLKIISKAIIESTSKQSSNKELLTSLFEEIRKILTGQKFLLVLDDVWNEDFRKWEELRHPLRYGAKGSKIIVSTRSEKVSVIMGTIAGYPLGILSNEDCFLLLRQRAFPNESWDEHPDLMAVGKKIVKKCKGVPLAVKTLGGLLRGTRKEIEWKYILTSEIWELTQDDILAPLRLSYHHLPSHLKQCFLYCSIFPKDYEFEEDKLVKLWMAEGFITSEVGQREMEDVGCEYFDDLLWRSFFQRDKNMYGDLIYKMHDLIHDLAKSVSKGECFRMEDDILFHFSEKARYSSFISHNENDFRIFETILKCKRLRTLLMSLRVTIEFEIQSVPNNIFLQLKFLRVVDLSDIKELPDSIGNLKHLRYLALSSRCIQRLPESISTLYNLQTLDLSNCDRLVELPKDTRNLINLRHLAFSSHYIHSTPQGVGALTCLQTLSMFVVSKECGHDVGQLMQLINLRGRLHISGLQKVVNVTKDILKNKQGIEELDLSWRSRGDDDDDNDANDASVAEEVLERLQTYPNLKILSIIGYYGERFPRWIGDPSFSKLEELTIMEMDKVRHLIPEFCVTEEAYFPCLRELHIENCKSLIALPKFLTSLHGLRLYYCSERILSSPLYFSSLISLDIRGLKNLKVIPSGLLKNIKALKELRIFQCKKLVSLVEDYEDCKHLRSMKRLQLVNCPKLTSLPNGMKYFIPLEDLHIQRCKRLSTLPEEGLPISLHSLFIGDCLLLEERCQGEDWHKISHIPNLRIYSGTIFFPFNLIDLFVINWKSRDECKQFWYAADVARAQNHRSFSLEYKRERCEVLWPCHISDVPKSNAFIIILIGRGFCLEKILTSSQS